MRLIAFCGPKGSGKDTAAKYLLVRNSLLRADLFAQINFADPLKAACQIIFGLSNAEVYDPTLKEVVLDRWPYKAPRELLQSVGNLFRTMYAADIWVRAWERRAKAVGAGKTACVVCTDLRHVEEYDKIRELDGKIIYIYNPKVEAQRTEGIMRGDPLWSDSSEAYTEFLRKSADVEVFNDGASLDALHTNVHAAVLQVMGDWKQWQELASMDGGVTL